MVRGTISIPHVDTETFKQFICPQARPTVKVYDIALVGGRLRSYISFTCPNGLMNCCTTKFQRTPRRSARG